MSTVPTISPEEFAQSVQNGAEPTLIDVRTPFEFQEVHVQFARNVPLDKLDPKQVADGHHSEKPIYVVCKSGARGKQACEKFLNAGISNVVNIDGGTSACEKTSLPITRGRKVMSLERQVRIAAGLLVLVGVGLSFVHPGFIGISAFVGAGLVFAGVTDTCGMGMMLAKMPWNTKGCGTSCKA